MGGRTGPLRRQDRLLRPREFQHVRRHGRRAAVRGFVVLVAKSGRDGGPRLGVTVSRRVGRAVVRNLVKRRIREWFRHNRPELLAGIDLVVIGRPGAGALEWPATTAALGEATRQAGGFAS